VSATNDTAPAKASCINPLAHAQGRKTALRENQPHGTWPRRQFLLAALGAPLLAAAVWPSPGAHAQSGEGSAAQALVPEATGPLLDLYPAGALHVVGNERFALGVVDPETGPIEDATIDLLFFTITGNQGTLTETLRAEFFPYGASEHHDHGTEGHAAGNHGDVTGIYVARPTFDKPGPWGVVARVTLPDGTVRAGQADFVVEAETDVPGPGDLAIASKTAVATTPEEIAAICTAEPVDDMHALSLDEAIASGKPTVVLFATPALCTSRVCGPSVEALQELKSRYGDRANFIHVEIYPERDYEKPAPAVAEWYLPSEPWLFLIDADGKIVERYEGGIGLTELDPAVEALVGASE
jgi:hypothetical protein